MILKQKYKLVIAVFMVLIGSYVGVLNIYGSEEEPKLVVKCDNVVFEWVLSSRDDNYLLKGFSYVEPSESIKPVIWCNLIKWKWELTEIIERGNRWFYSEGRILTVKSCPFSGYISFFKIIDDGDSTDEWKYVLVPTRCADPNNPYGVFTGEGITEWSVLFKVDDVKPLALSYDGSSLMEGEIAVVDANGNVVSKPVGDLIVEATAPDWQPQFVDIALLQLKNISYLTDQLTSQDSNFDITDILTPRALSWYQQLLTKIRFDTRLAMADDIYQPVTLKDIGILAQIQDGLLKRLALGTTASIDISHNPYDPLDNYTLTEIQNILKTDLVLAKSLMNSNFAQLTGYDSLRSYSWYSAYDELVKMWKGDISDNQTYLIGFNQNLRKTNIDFLENQANSEQFNLLGIYNGYYENLQALKGDQYAQILKNIKESPATVADQFEKIGDILDSESQQMWMDSESFWGTRCVMFSSPLRQYRHRCSP